MKIIVDRIIDDNAVVELENGQMLNIPTQIIGEAEEGDAIIITVEKRDNEQNTDTHSIFEKLRNKNK